MKKILNRLEVQLNNSNTNYRHPKCKGFRTPDYGWGSEYGMGRRNPESKRNKL